MSDQQMFDNYLNILWKVAKWLFKALVYFPLIITSFIIVSSIMNKESSSLLGLAVTILMTFILYLAVYFVKGILICLKSNRKLLWILPFIICVAFTCILPVYLVLDPIGYLVQHSSHSNTPNNIFKWLFSLAFGVYVYYRYDFLKNIAPPIAFPAYQAGIDITMLIINRSYRVKGEQSDETI
ncbi:hypothetical protein [Chitinophaga ginsengisoli]|uniref:Uncharacterized protein n=1 Tax=Chitinophaga ginsengisoli TaxID=363837 RepID=A0A2P8GQF1_9BACT|nr:hypothetical protein [Chitinophaga ginsengisoli]PSL36174.1 hypothetical protein CLV42_101943 [Chitinophaga ginsengisoli]